MSKEMFRKWLITRMAAGGFILDKEITPDMAEVMLEFNTGNRTLSRKRAISYGRDMKSGGWMLTGEPIIFAKEGILNDGQTRLSGCVSSKTSFRTDIRFGIERAAFVMTGTGAKRSFCDVLSISGEKSARSLAAALLWFYRYDRGSFEKKVELSSLDGIALLDDNPDIRNSVSKGNLLYSKKHVMEPSLAIALHYILALKDADAADEFFDFLITGLGATGSRDPRYALRERLINNKTEKAPIGSVDIAALTIKAWNLVRAGKNLRGHLGWISKPAEGKSAEQFPKAI